MKKLAIIRIIVTVGIIALSLSIYFNALLGEFLLSWDDSSYVLNNLLIRDLSLNHILKIYSTPFYGAYEPMTILSFAVDNHFWGLDPYGYHLTNILIHILNSILVYILIIILLKKHDHSSGDFHEIIAAFGAFIFASHPVQVESVAWISERKNVLSMFFFLIAFISYLNYKETLKRLYYDFSLIFFFIALISKSIVVTFPLLITLYDLTFYWKKSDSVRFLLSDKIPFFIFSIAIGIMTILAHANEGYLMSHPSGDPTYTFFTMLKVVILYIRNSLLPVNLSALYEIKIPTSFIDPSVLFSFLTILTIIIIVIYFAKKDKFIFYGILLFFVPLLPVSNIVKIAIFMTDRYLYIPMIGFSLLLSIILYRIINILIPRTGFKKKAILYLIIASFIIYEYSFLAIKRTEVWNNDLILWDDAVVKGPTNGDIHYLLSKLYTARGRYLDAFAHITRALEIKPSNKRYLFQRSLIFTLSGNYARGERDLKRLQNEDPNWEMSYYGLGISYFLQNRFEESDDAWGKYLELHSSDSLIDDPVARTVRELKKNMRDNRLL